MLISEIYNSRQGEGTLVGTPSVFVRTSGCNLRCHFCDTPFASWDPVGKQMSIEEIVAEVVVAAAASLPPIVEFGEEQIGEGDGQENELSSSHVVLTGGEPMLPRDVDALCAAIKSAGFHITIETAGTIFRDLECDLVSISPKLSNSTPTIARVGDERAGQWQAKHESARHRPELVKSLIQERDYQLKFVVDQESDIGEIERYLDELNGVLGAANCQSVDPLRVLLMPEGIDADSLEQRRTWLEPLSHAKGFTYCPRLHIQWYGNKRAT